MAAGGSAGCRVAPCSQSQKLPQETVFRLSWPVGERLCWELAKPRAPLQPSKCEPKITAAGNTLACEILFRASQLHSCDYEWVRNYGATVLKTISGSELHWPELLYRFHPLWILHACFVNGRFLALVIFFVPGYFGKNAHPVFSNTFPPAPPNSNVAANCSPRGR